jgi:hypothetical protein
MYSILKDFAGPFATVVAAGAASFVVLYFNRAQLRIAEQRLVLDLFDRRWEIVEDLRSAIAGMATEGIVMADDYRKYARASLRAAYLFGSDVTDYLETVRQAMERHVALQDSVRSEDDIIRVRAADGQAAAFTDITDFYKTIDPLIVPYMSLHQKLPQ